ncbi:DUF952 domain-containing protein [Albimonas pacifica]|uniref:Uncharacterized conserved protein, DUF952 family n=1 Tax=Albimonas pacifica TaxID=1114924 RepID=A0A1I3FJG9_9RHOB|nr:DUF952 domain-containing protein [Albimonas pacifica]SFI11262.1 Uncharacterized conserved protein, DUF952 family [Albimonas pacifica]
MNDAVRVLDVFKILRPDECSRLVQTLVFSGSEHDLRDGFVHLSTAAQAPGTAAKHFAQDGDLWIASLRTAVLGESLHWEESRGGALFPHLYREIRASDVGWIRPLPRDAEGRHAFPEGVAWGEPDA